MNMSISSVKPDRQVEHPLLPNPMECSKIYLLRKIKRLKNNHEKRKIGQEIRQEQSWL